MQLQRRSPVIQTEPWLTTAEQTEVIEAMLRFGILKWDNDRNLPLKSGGKTDVYINLRNMRDHPDALAYFSWIFENPLRRLRVDRIADVPQAVSCLLGSLAASLNVPAVTIRDNAKQGRVSAADMIGTINHGDIIGQFDDVITDGASKIPGYFAVKRRGGIPYLVVLVDRQQGWQQTFSQHDIEMPVWAGMTLHDVRSYLIRNGMLQRCDPLTERQNPVIVALDGMKWDTMLPIVDKLRTTGVILKINDAVTAAGVDGLLPKLSIYGRVMVDVKADDIPNTVENICRQIKPHNPWAVTVHASGGPTMLKKALEVFSDTDTIVLAITVLTSIDDKTGQEIYGRLPKTQVKRLAGMAYNAGVRGFVCSPEEVSMLRDDYPDCTLVTPGVRSPGVNTNDQKRVTTPKEALDRGTNYIVIGRQATQNQDPKTEIQRVLSEELLIST